MLKIKLARFGKKGQPHYRIVVNEAKSKRDGQYVAKLGEYAPTFSPKILKLDLKEYALWLEKGAQPTETVANLAKRAASKDPFPAKKARLSKKARDKIANPQVVEPEEAPEKTAPEVVTTEATEEEAVTKEVVVAEDSVVTDSTTEAAAKTTPEATADQTPVVETKE